MINKVRETYHMGEEHRRPHGGHHHHAHKARHNVLSIVYDQEKMQKVYGDIWPHHLEKISAEPPEMKMLFALQMGFKVAVNSGIMEHMKNLYKEEVNYRFSSPALDPTYNAMERIALKLGISEEDASVILGFAPEGVLSIVISAAEIGVSEGGNEVND